MLTSALWNLFYLTGLIGMMCFAYYSRHEHTQRLALCILGIYATSVAVYGTPLEAPAFLFFDLIGAGYCIYLRLVDPGQKITQLVMWVFIAMIWLHIWQLGVGIEWLKYKIAGNLLFLAQLTALCFYGKRYGLISRAESSEHRSDPYYRMLTTCRLMLKT